MTDPFHRWYVARFLSGREITAARRCDNIQPASDDSPKPRAFCPLVRRHWRQHNQDRNILSPALPGNVFIEMPPVGFHADRYHEVAACIGFLGFIGGGMLPTTVVAKDINPIIAGLDPESWEIELEPRSEPVARFKRGDIVYLPFLDGEGRKATAVVEWISTNGLDAQVSTRWLFGREQRISIDATMLERVHVNSKEQRRTLMSLPKRQVGAMPMAAAGSKNFL